MEIVLLIVVVFIIYAAVASVISKNRQSIRNKAAESVLYEFDFEKEKQSILDMNSEFLPAGYKCPECKGMLVTRNGKYGRFIGCSQYPNCKYTKSV